MERDRFQESEADMPVVSRKRPLTRLEVLEKASQVLEVLHGRTVSKKFEVRQSDSARLAYARAFVSALAAYSGLLKDEDLDDIKRRLDALEAKQARA